MLQLSTVYYDRKILSLRTGGPIGHALSPVINPNNLRFEGWYATAIGERDPKILPVGEVRDIIQKGIVVDDHVSITDMDDLIRIKDIVDTGYEVIGKIVKTDSKRRLGKVQDYAVDDKTMYIKKLYISQNMIKNFSTQQLIIDRDQIVEINDKEIIVRETTSRVGSTEQIAATA